MKKTFRRAFIEITDACNLSCGFCAPGGRGSPRFMTPAAFEAAAAEVGPLASVVSLHVLGEPFMHPDLPSILEICSRLGLRLNLVTNGTLLDKFGPSIFAEPCLEQLSFSLRALSELPAAGREASLSRLIEFAFRKKPGTIISFRLRGGSGDLFVEETGARLLKAFGKEAKKPVSPAGPCGKSPGIKLSEGVFLNPGRMFSWPGQTSGRSRGCLGLKHHFAILCSGRVVPCCADHEGRLSLGELGAGSLREMLFSPAADRLREALSGKAPLPSYCTARGFE